MSSRFTFAAMALAAPLLLAACEREAQQQQTEGGQAAEPPTVETEAAAPAAPAQPAESPAMAEQPPAAQPGEEAAVEPQDDAAESEGQIAVAPPAEEAAPDERQTAQAQNGQEAPLAPGEASPEAAGVASVSAYVGRWAEEPEMCQRSYWTFTNLRLQSPEREACDILSTAAQQDGVDLEVACTDEGQPLAEPRRGTMSLAFPDLPQTDTMAATGGPVEDEELTLHRCPLG